MWKQVITLFREYMGTGLIIGWFLLSIGYLFFTEKRKHIRILFLYVPIILLLLFFNPLFAKIVYRFMGDEVYYRILWLLPVTIVIAYTIINIYTKLEGKIRLAWLCIASILIILSGSFIYQNTYFKKAENLYHVPQAVVDICKAIEFEGREVMAAFPAELMQYVRQYSPVVCMPYGREMLVERWQQENELYKAMQAEKIDVTELVPLAKEKGCHYLIFSKEKEIQGRLEDFDYILFKEVDGYVIYKDTSLILEY